MKYRDLREFIAQLEAQGDIAGGTMAGRLARGRITTVAVKEFIFKQPVKVGDLLSFYAEITRVGTTSITVNVEVYAQRLRDGGDRFARGRSRLCCRRLNFLGGLHQVQFALAAGIPLAIAEAIIAGDSPQQIAKDAMNMIDAILGFVMPLCDQMRR